MMRLQIISIFFMISKICFLIFGGVYLTCITFQSDKAKLFGILKDILITQNPIM